MLKGPVKADSTLANVRAHAKERVGQLLLLQGKEHTTEGEFAEGDIGAVAKLKETQTGDLLLETERAVDLPKIDFFRARDELCGHAQGEGRRGQGSSVVAAALRGGPDARAASRRADREQLLAGLSQMHVEVAVDRLHRRFGVDVDLAQPRVPYLETIRTESGRGPDTRSRRAAAGSSATARSCSEPRPGHEGYEFVDKIVGGVIPQSFRPAVDKGIQEAMLHGELAGAPVQGVTVRLVDGSTTMSTPPRWRSRSPARWRSRTRTRRPTRCCSSRSWSSTVTVPDEAVGAVNGDLNSRRGRLHGMEPLGGMTTIKAEVPMAEVLTYSQSLTSLTGGRGDYHMSFARYEEVPLSHRPEADRGRQEGKRVRKGQRVWRNSDCAAESLGRCSCQCARALRDHDLSAPRRRAPFARPSQR